MYSLTNKGILELRSLAKMSNQDLIALGKDVTLPVLESIKVSDKPTVHLISQATGFQEDRVTNILKHLMSAGYVIPKPPKPKYDAPTTPEPEKPVTKPHHMLGRVMKPRNPNSWFQKLSPEKKAEIREKNRERSRASRSKSKAHPRSSMIVEAAKVIESIKQKEGTVLSQPSPGRSIEDVRGYRRNWYKEKRLKEGKTYKPRGAQKGRSSGSSPRVREEATGYYLTQKGMDELNKFQGAGESELKKHRRLLMVPVLLSIHTSPRPTFSSMKADTGLKHGELAGTLANLYKLGYIEVPHVSTNPGFPGSDKSSRYETFVERYGGVTGVGRGRGRHKEGGEVKFKSQDPLLDRFSDEVTKERLQIDLKERLRSSLIGRFPELDESSINTMTDRVYRNIVD